MKQRAAKFGTNVASPADKDGVINCAKQIQLTGEHICQLDLRGTVDYRSLSAGDATLDINVVGRKSTCT